MTDQHPLFAALTGLAARPAPYALLTTPELWTDPHLAGRMLAAHLDRWTSRRTGPPSWPAP
ncbi:MULTISPECIES: hypothetical protein [Streptomyces]|uniref:hypothetical protein n=1 Tax=Streptomyces TaxID=1883 RepID=UPI000A5BA03B|nr:MULTISPECIES: hypothetical protein [Streptomyces]